MREARREVIREAHQMLRAVDENIKQAQPERAWMLEPMLNYFDVLEDAMRRERPMIWHFLTLSQEPLRAMDAAVFSPEYAAAVFSILGIAFKYYDLAADRMPEHICVLNRFPAGLSLSGDTVTPDIMLYTAANPCDAGLISYSSLERHFRDMPFFCVDIPPNTDARTLRYVGRQLREMVSFIEGKLPLKMDMDKLRRMIRFSNQGLEIHRRLLEYQKLVPCPTPSLAHLLHGYANMGVPGLFSVVEWFERQEAWLADKVKRGEGAVPDEKIRLAWIANNIDFDLSIYDWLETEYGAVSVACAMSLLNTDPIDPEAGEAEIFEGLAMRTMTYPMPMFGRVQVDAYIRRCVEIVNEYKADAVIFAGNVGCKYHWTTAKLVKDRLTEALDKPVLAFEVSPWDSRVLSSEGIKAKFEQFFETFF
jgi:benzoyl-CoA reductase/2-hydroxyglutaryl-CoA dehydratase subunit BcrC/BadD/HgdB